MARSLVLFLLLATVTGCRPHARAERLRHCDKLFGRPGHHTGLGADDCAPRCASEDFDPPIYTAEDQARLREWTLLDAPGPLTSNPYDDPPELTYPGPEEVCGVLRVSPDSLEYRLVDYPTEDAARAAGAFPTHFGRCGVCSTLHDLSVYMHVNDLTEATKHCGIRHHPGSNGDVECLVELGFTEPCAQIWAYNTRNTAHVCRHVCVEDMFKRYHHDDGALNACLRCDEEHSGPVFKEVAGRTRRNTGLPNAICRPCSEVQPLVHRYE